MTPERFDIIIGSGAGGGTLAHRLAPSGKRILRIERGDYVPREKANWSPRAVNVEGRYQAKEEWHDPDGKPLHPHTNYCVGGNTKFYGAALFRLRRDDFGEVRHYEGISAVSCGAINSAALLLRSRNNRHPRGLANSSDVVGRHCMGHVNSVLMAFSKCPNPTVFQKTLAVNDFHFGSKEWPHPMGHISFVGKLDGETLSAGAPAIAPGWTLDLMARHSLDFWLTSEDLPDPDNRVTLDREGKVVLRYTPNNEEGHRRLIGRLKELMKQQTKCPEHGHDCHQGLFAGNLYVGQRIPLAGVAHQNGTVRFGRNPKTSALDVHCKAHGLDNLYVVDGGFFPSSAAVNPALTIMANALRVGDHLLERMK